MHSIKRMITRTRVEGLIIFLVAIGYMWEAQNVPDLFQTPGVPGPTAFPDLLGIVFALSGLWLLLSADKRIAKKKDVLADEDEEASKTPSSAGAGLLQRIASGWHFYTMWVVVLGYLILMPWLGFPVATAVLLAAFFVLLGETRWSVVIGLALLVTTVIYAVFATGLNVRLPLGVLEPVFRSTVK